jgi:hypothetical protein
MATVTTYDLIKCNSNSEILPSVNNVGLSAYNGSVLKFDNNKKKSYKVVKNVQARFLDGINPTSGFKVRWSVTSMKFNGLELMDATSISTIGVTDIVWTNFPFYNPGNEFFYTGNVANGIVVSDSLVSLGYGANNFYRFIESIINYYGISVKISKSPSNWWAPKPNIQNVIIEKYFDDYFEFTFDETTINTSTLVETTNTKRYVFDGSNVQYFLNNVLVTTPSTSLPQYEEDFSFFSYNFNYTVLQELDKCPAPDPFFVSISNDGCSNLEINCDCTKLSFADTSNYTDNGMTGHDIDSFNSRKITITRPDGSKFIMGTSDISPKDLLIGPPYASPNLFSYSFGDTDMDGIYSIQICSYPDWSSTATYESYLFPIVRRNGILYKCKSTSNNIDPATDTSSVFWTVYECTDNCDDTRYCTTKNIVVLCISLLKCYKKLVADAFCSVENAGCKDISLNKQFQNAMKFRVTLDAIEFSVCAGDWDSAKKQIEILKSICCCI